MRMLTAVKGDVLNNPWVVRKTREILAFQARLEKVADRAAQKLGTIIANIGDKLIAIKESLDDTPDKTAWLRWLKNHVHYSQRKAYNFIQVAKLREKNLQTFASFLSLDISCLYSIASVPEQILSALKHDTPLRDPRTGKEKPLDQMSKRELDRALRFLEHGKHEVRTAESITQRLKAMANELHKIKADPDLAKGDWQRFQEDNFTQSSDGQGKAAPAILQGVTWDEVGNSLLAHLEWLAKITRELKASGKLKGTLKKALIDKHEKVRRALLKLPAWARSGK